MSAAELKQRGNDAYGAGDHAAAVGLYTEAIAAATVNGERVLEVYLFLKCLCSNRSVFVSRANRKILFTRCPVQVL
jgi:hypothetical protein